jgi:hypothetical protein
MSPQELKNSILQLAIQGKLVPQRPEEGSAEELLAAIRTQKQSLDSRSTVRKKKNSHKDTETQSAIPDDEIPDDPVEPTLAEKYAFNAKNSVSSANGGLWDINSGNVFVKEWDATANAMKITMVNARAYMQGRDFVTYTTIEMLKEAQSAGYAGISFKVVSADGAFTEEGRGLRVYSKQNAGRDTAGITTNASAGIYEYKDFGIEAGTTEITVTIDIAEFLALNANGNYIGIVLNMPVNTTAYFSDMQFLKN